MAGTFQLSNFLTNTSYAVPHVRFSQRYFSFFLYFVFALAERKNEIQIK
jgi:hypothetical protein